MSGLRSNIVAATALLLMPAPLRMRPKELPLDIQRGAITGPPVHEAKPPTYFIATVIDYAFSDDRNAETDILEKVLQEKVKRVDKADKEFKQVQTCSSYPCEVVVEEISEEKMEEISGGYKVYSFMLLFKVVKGPGDHSPGIPGHPPASEPWECRTHPPDFTSETCQVLAPLQLAKLLEEHDQEFHSGGHP
jgi:hypothetical protein